MRHNLLFFALFSSVLGLAQNTNYATVSGNWSDCSTWGNPAKLYNSSWCDKVINPSITVTQNIPSAYILARKITLSPGSKILLPNNNPIILSAQVSLAETVCDNSPADLLDKITVNFAETVNNKSLVGYLHGLYNVNPSDAAILELRPKLSRQVYTEFYQRAYNLTSSGDSKGRVHMVMADRWREEYTYDVLPNANFTVYEDYLNDNFFSWGALPDVNGTSPKPGIVWECWNEPNAKSFWNPSDVGTGVNQWHNDDIYYWPEAKKAQFFETYKVFYNTIKGSALGCGALVAGPSIANFDKVHLKDFFDYCLKEHLQVNVVTWHELDDYRITLLKENVAWVRDNFMNNSKYAALNIQSIEINEIVGPDFKDNAAGTGIYLSLLEQAKVDAASKACWTDASTPPNGCCDACFSNTLNHIFAPSNEKRPNWYIHKWYSDGVNSRITATNELTANSFAIASRNIVAPLQTYAQVLFGYTDIWGDLNINPNPYFKVPDEGTFEVKLDNMSALPFISGINCSYRVRTVLKATGQTDAAVVSESLGTATISNNSISLNISVVQDRLYQLTIWNYGSPTPP